MGQNICAGRSLPPLIITKSEGGWEVSHDGPVLKGEEAKLWSWCWREGADFIFRLWSISLKFSHVS